MVADRRLVVNRTVVVRHHYTNQHPASYAVDRLTYLTVFYP